MPVDRVWLWTPIKDVLYVVLLTFALFIVSTLFHLYHCPCFYSLISFFSFIYFLSYADADDDAVSESESDFDADSVKSFIINIKRFQPLNHLLLKGWNLFEAGCISLALFVLIFNKLAFWGKWTTSFLSFRCGLNWLISWINWY